MTLMPSRHVRDPRQRYRANKVRKVGERSVPPIVRVNPGLVSELVSVAPHVRTAVLARIATEHGPGYAEEVLRQVADKLRERRKP